MSGECPRCHEHATDCECSCPFDGINPDFCGVDLEALPQPMEWVSVKNRLPKGKERVGYTYDGKNIRHDVYFERTTNKWEHENSLSFYENVDVTHWMPLPESPYKEYSGILPDYPLSVKSTQYPNISKEENDKERFD